MRQGGQNLMANHQGPTRSRKEASRSSPEQYLSPIGWWLQDPFLVGCTPKRSWHCWLMFGVVILVAVPVWLNG